MAANPIYIFQGSNLGNEGVLRDALNIPEMFYFFQKKFFGFPNTVPDILYSSELVPSFATNIPNSFPYIQQNKIYGQPIPLSNSMIDSLFNFVPTAASIDPTFINSNYIFFGCNMTADLNSSRWLSRDLPYICYYSNLLLSPLTNNKNRYNTTLYSNFTTTYRHPLLINSISGNHDVSYFPHLYTNNGGSEIYGTDGYWLLDNDTGVVMFYDSNAYVQQVNASNPPRISFFRYEGLLGEASVTQGQYL